MTMKKIDYPRMFEEVRKNERDILEVLIKFRLDLLSEMSEWEDETEWMVYLSLISNSAKHLSEILEYNVKILNKSVEKIQTELFKKMKEKEFRESFIERMFKLMEKKS